jgi:hypothetical protein
MRRPASRCYNDQGLTEVVSITLMVILVIAVAAIIASIVFGLAIFFPKSAYIVVQTEAKNASPDNWYLSVSHMNGDAAYLNHTLAKNEGMPVDFQFTNTTLGTIIPKPDQADGPETWKPGDNLFVYRDPSGYVWVTKNETVAQNGIGLPQGVWRFDVVDKTDDVLIYTKNVGVGMPTPVNTYSITATSGTNGAITPAGVTTINSGGSQSYAINPDTGYHVSDVIVDGSSVGNVTTYQFTNVVASHTISATFAITTYPVTATSGSNGNVVPAGITMVNSGASQVYTVTPDPGYHFDILTVDGSSATLTGPNTYTFTNVQAPHSITATFTINTYTINATSGANGLVTPGGISTVNYGATPTYSITPITGYHVADVLVNGASVGAITTFTFTSVTANQTISATFAPNAGLSITQLNPSSATAGGAGFTLTVTGTGYILGSTVYWNGGSRSTTYVSPTQVTATILAADIASAGTTSVTVVNPGPVTSNAATFTINPNTFTITATSGSNGAVTPSGISTVNYGATPTYSITPSTGYHVASVLVNGAPLGAVTSYTFPAVTSNQVISATFAVNTYTITASAGAGGSISPAGSVSVNYGGSQTFAITPDATHHLASLTVDGSPVTPAGSYTFSSVMASHTIAATFVLNTQHAITVSWHPFGQGTISPSGTVNVPYDADQSFTITATKKKGISNIVVDGVDLGIQPDSPYVYTFHNVIATHTLDVIFSN